MNQKPIVWAFCNGMYGPDDQAWMAISDDGVVITEHISSNERWGAHDVSPERKPIAYVDAIGTPEVDYRVLPLKELPPEYVRERMLTRKAEAEQ